MSEKKKEIQMPKSLEEAIKQLSPLKPKHKFVYHKTKKAKGTECPLVKQVREDAVEAYLQAGWALYGPAPKGAKAPAPAPTEAKKVS